MNIPKIYHPHYWHRRAEQLRTMAEGIHTLDERKFLFQIADEYDFLAARAGDSIASQSSNHPGN